MRLSKETMAYVRTADPLLTVFANAADKTKTDEVYLTHLVDTEMSPASPSTTEQLPQVKMLEGVSNRHALEQFAGDAPYPSSLARIEPSNSPPRIPFQQGQSLGVQVITTVARCGRGHCRCICHSTRKIKTPGGLFNRVAGQLSLSYNGLSVLSPACNIPSCEATRKPEVTAEYWFPMGLFWSMIVQFNLSYQTNVGPQFELKTLRRVPDTAACINYAIKGNIEGLKELFRRGAASPHDVSDTRGYSLLRVSGINGTPTTSRAPILTPNPQHVRVESDIAEGADADYRPKAPTDLSPRAKANDLLLQGVSKATEDALMPLSGGGDWADEQEFTALHRIVTGLSSKSLEMELQEHPEDIDKQDGLGRSPISWAAARGNEEHVTLLLSHGANPNILDVQLSGPVTYSADRSHAGCTRLLLNAHAQTDPILPAGAKIGSPLNCAARNANDPAVIELLLQYGADPNATGVDLRTPLIHAARKNKPDFANIMLAHGANINAMASDGQTPLTTAIINNSHDVLGLLLERWEEYSTCPRSIGPSLLRIVAQYADIQTISILQRADYFRLTDDKQQSESHFEDLLKARHDVDEKLLVAFSDFIDKVRPIHFTEAREVKDRKSAKKGSLDVEKGQIMED
ncbi:hypothetical protein O1611_g6903 [Lasiodiplodia mahajangana]|uniref:Uncharacterized protein n=1 Tax=Lasiodiplodia mahajangana TaxID=1108764 RepID=A0ACC2JGY4_9PEZI|nr:hypothetical protein O1611_g6903 [Lasiodiplodia mahajangana]